MLCWLVTEPQETLYFLYPLFRILLSQNPSQCVSGTLELLLVGQEKSLHYVFILNVQEVLSVSMWETKSSVCHHTKQRELLAREISLQYIFLRVGKCTSRNTCYFPSGPEIGSKYPYQLVNTAFNSSSLKTHDSLET